MHLCEFVSKCSEAKNTGLTSKTRSTYPDNYYFPLIHFLEYCSTIEMLIKEIEYTFKENQKKTILLLFTIINFTCATKLNPKIN